MAQPALILIVDDNEMNRDMLSRRLERDGYRTTMAEDGLRALAVLAEQPVDLMLLDIMMPHMNGYDVLQRVKQDPALRHIPVIIISAVSDLDSVVRCIEIGAEDYLFKPFNPILLKARVDASLERKRLNDWQRQHLANLEQRSTMEMAAIPAEFVTRFIPDASILLAEVMDIDTLIAQAEPVESLDVLNELFAGFNRLVGEWGGAVTRSLAGWYRVGGGILEPLPQHCVLMADLALEMRLLASRFRLAGKPLSLRIGISSGPVTVGVIDSGKYYDVWGTAAHGAYHAAMLAAEGQIYLTTELCSRLSPDSYQYRPVMDSSKIYELQGKN